jgi:hypothetical protein
MSHNVYVERKSMAGSESKYGNVVCKRCGKKGLTWFEKEQGKWQLVTFHLDDLGNNILWSNGRSKKNGYFYAHTVHTRSLCEWYQSDERAEQEMRELAWQLQLMMYYADPNHELDLSVQFKK